MFTQSRLLLLLIAVFFSEMIFGQSSHFTTNDYWKHQRKEIFIGVGATNILSDLGGLDKVGTDYSPIDLEWSMTRFNFHTGFRYRLKQFLATKSVLTYALFQADDALTAEPARRNRNLKVRTHLFEFSQHFEIIIFNDEQYGYRYKPLGVKGVRHKNKLLYIIVGGSFFMYVPQSPTGVNLRPLRTEGQGLPGAKYDEPYKLYSFGIPMGIGYKMGLGATWRLSFELTYTKTFTDYLDDVSTTYYDNNAILNNYGETAAYFADPSPGYFPTWTNHGEMRGDDKHNDAYLYFNMSFIKNLTYKKKRGNKWKASF